MKITDKKYKKQAVSFISMKWGDNPIEIYYYTKSDGKPVSENKVIRTKTKNGPRFYTLATA